ncbi:MAG: hypothetical protein ACFFB3_15565 [Candidatus Hodarchaeota archaeon]
MNKNAAFFLKAIACLGMWLLGFISMSILGLGICFACIGAWMVFLATGVASGFIEGAAIA